MQKICVALTLILILTACSGGDFLTGTETGNALVPVSGPNPTGALTSNLVSDVCNAIKSCASAADVSQCQTQLNIQSGLPQLLGVPASTGITTLSELGTAVLQGTVTASESAAESCVSGIAALSCTSPAAQAAYNPATGSFAGVSGEFSQVSSCADVYSVP